MLAWCVYFVVVCLGFTAGQNMIVSPVNTAAERGSFARLNCTADLAKPGGGDDTLEWRQYLDETTGTRIVASTDPDDVTGEAYSLDYDVDEGRYDLMIDMSKDVGGNYNCHIFGVDIRGEAQVVALDQFNCGTRNGVTKAVEGQMVALDCGVIYKGYKKPSLEWSSKNGMQPGYYEDDEDNPQNVFYVANVTAQPGHDKMEFTCSLAFERGEDDEEDPPHYRETCTTSFEVEHGATDIKISPNPDNDPDGVIGRYVGEDMNCSASGNPEPDIYWYDNEGGIVDSEDGTMLITNDMITDEEEPVEYRCVASNWINMAEHKTEKTVRIIVYAAPDTPPAVTEGGLEDWAIALIVVIPVLVIAGVGVALFYMWWKKRSDSDAATQEKPTNYPESDVEPNPIYSSEDKPKKKKVPTATLR